MPVLFPFKLLVWAVLSFLQACSPASNQQELPEIAQWRGINRDGIYNETGLLDIWPENGPELLWKFDGIGKGYASPSVLHNQIFFDGEIDSISHLFSFDLAGNLLWKTPNGEEFMGEGFSATYPGSRSTPTVVGNLVYATSGKSRVACFQVETGKEVWAVDLIKDLGGLDNLFGYSESVLFDDNKIFCFPGGIKHNTVALDAKTGEISWSSEAMKDTFSYCSPVLVKLPEWKVIITHSRHHLYALDANTGETLGAYFIDHYEYDGEHCNSPVYANGNIYFIGNEKEVGTVRLSVSENGNQIREIWKNDKIKNNFNGFVKVGDKLFTTIKGNWLKALNIENGAVEDSVKVATGSLIFADNKFFIYGMNGEVSLVDYSENKMDVRSTFKVKDGTGHHFSHPVLADGIMYIRHGNALMAYKVK